MEGMRSSGMTAELEKFIKANGAPAVTSTLVDSNFGILENMGQICS